MYSQTFSQVQSASGLHFTRPKDLSHSIFLALARVGAWSRRIPVTQAARPASLALSGSTLRNEQHWFGSMVQIFGVLFRRVERFHSLDANAVFLLDLVDQLVGFGEKKIGIQGEHADFGAHE